MTIEEIITGIVLCIISFLLGHFFYPRVASVFLLLKKEVNLLKNRKGKKVVLFDNVWFENNHCIAHALGGIDGVLYTNSKEAFEASYKRGINIFECDVSYTMDGVPVLWHKMGKGEITCLEDFKSNLIDYRFHALSLEDLFSVLEEHPRCYALIDSKQFESIRVAKSILEIARLHYSNRMEILERFIIQISNKRQYYAIKRFFDFKYFHFIYSKEKNLLDIIDFLIRSDIHTVSIRNDMFDEDEVKVLRNNNIYPYIYAPYSCELDSITIVTDYLERGAYGVLTNYLSDSMITKIGGKEL